jgi:hypothetical protein
MAGVVTPYGLMELGMLTALAPFYPAHNAGWIRPNMATRPLVCWLAYLVMLAALGLALYARVQGIHTIMALPLMFVPLAYWFIFVRIENETSKKTDDVTGDTAE